MRSTESRMADTPDGPVPRRRRRDLSARERRDLARQARRGTTPAAAPADPADLPASAAPVDPAGPAAPADPAGPAPRSDVPTPSVPSRARSTRRRWPWVLGALIVVLGGLATWWVVEGRPGVPGADGPAEEIIGSGGAAGTIALVVTDPDADDAALRIVILGIDPVSDEASVLFVPVATVADLPGFGSFPIGDATVLDGPSLAAVGLTNLLGIRLDAVVVTGIGELADQLAALGPFEVESSDAVVLDAGLGGWEFPTGVQTHDAVMLTTFLGGQATDEGELAALGRAGRAVQALLQEIAADPEAAAPVLASLFTDAVTAEGPRGDDRAAADASTVLVSIATAAQEGRSATLTAPVSAVGSGEDAAFRLDPDRLTDLLETRLPAARPTGPGAGVRLQLLNGNGVPNVGLPVAARLVDGGYRVVLTDNADRFTYETTRIIVYEETAAMLAVAEDLQQRLGTGTIERATTPQSVVDVTIVIGADLRQP